MSYLHCTVTNIPPHVLTSLVICKTELKRNRKTHKQCTQSPQKQTNTAKPLSSRASFKFGELSKNDKLISVGDWASRQADAFEIGFGYLLRSCKLRLSRQENESLFRGKKYWHKSYPINEKPRNLNRNGVAFTLYLTPVASVHIIFKINVGSNIKRNYYLFTFLPDQINRDLSQSHDSAKIKSIVRYRQNVPLKYVIHFDSRHNRMSLRTKVTWLVIIFYEHGLYQGRKKTRCRAIPENGFQDTLNVTINHG